MASGEDGLRDDMDSLFEGMILFNPSETAVTDDQNHNHQGEHHTQPIIIPSIAPHLRPDDPSPPTSSSSASHTQPLDENLFSDLTLVSVTPLQTPPSAPQFESPLSFSPATTIASTAISPATSLTSRQFSTRKKKKAGLRIGYGRDDSTPDDPPPPPLSVVSCSVADSQAMELGSPRSSPPSSSSVTAVGIIQSGVAPKDDDEAAASSPTPDTLSISFPNLHLRPGFHPSSTTPGVEEEDKEADSGDAIELKFEQVKASVSKKLKHAREMVDSVSAERKILIKTRRKAAEDVNMASTKYKDLENLLEKACEAEDFETADKLSESLASVEKEKEALAIALRNAEADCDAIEFKMQEVLERQILAEEESASVLEQFGMDAANSAEFVLKNAEVVSTKEMDKWHLSTEALEVKRMELEIESHLISGSRLVLNDSIEHSVENDRTERELLYEKKERLTEELRKLLALVQEKEGEIAENNLHIELVEQRIANVVSSFQEVQVIMDTKYENLQYDISQIVLDSEALARKKEEIDERLSQEKNREAKLREVASTVADEANMYHEVVRLRRSLMLSVLKSRDEKMRLAKTEENLSHDVQMLKQEISGARSVLQELSSTKSGVQQEIESLKQRLLFIDKRNPELEADKKVAAAARNFKEAARIAAEAKALSVEKDAVQIKLEDYSVEIGKVEAEIWNTVNSLHETEEQISLKEKELAVARFHRLLLIAGAAKSESSAALELGDLVEAEIWHAEAESAESEAHKLQPVVNPDDEELATLPHLFISMELVSKLSGKQLLEMAASASIAL